MDAITVSQLTKTFGKVKAVNNLSFSVPEKSVFGFLGPNGAGKTTVIRMLVGLSRPNAGTINLAGEEVVFGNSDTHRLFGYLPETPTLYPWMTGTEYLDFTGKLFKLNAEERRRRTKTLLKRVGLHEAARKRIGGYSGGMKQRLGIAQALIGRPKLVILDEPVSALDPLGRREVLAIIEELKQDTTVFMSTHILADVDRICDQVLILNHGQLALESSMADLKTSQPGSFLEVEFDKDPGPALANLSQQPWVKKSEHDGAHLCIWLHDNAVLKTNLPLKSLSSLPVGVLSYGQHLPDIEEVFVNLVEGKV